MKPSHVGETKPIDIWQPLLKKARPGGCQLSFVMKPSDIRKTESIDIGQQLVKRARPGVVSCPRFKKKQRSSSSVNSMPVMFFMHSASFYHFGPVCTCARIET